jgi:hypothetical protein
VTVSLQDAYGNVVTSAADSVTVQLTSGSGSLVGTTTVAAVEGIASFAGLTVEVAGSGKRITATSGTLTSAVSDSFAVSAAAAASLAFVQQPTAVVAGAAISPAVTVGVQDAYGNAVPDMSVELSLVGTGTLTGGAPVATDSTGLATFAALSIDLAGGKQLSATSGALTPVLSDTFTVGCAAIVLEPSSLEPGVSGTPYEALIGASGGLPPYAFVVTVDSLPPGLTLHPSTGVLSGTLTTSGTFDFTITATDSGGCFGERAYSLCVCPAIAVLPDSLPAASVGVPYAQVFTASAGMAPFGFSVTSGVLPSGLSLATDGTLSGTPSEAGTFDFTVTATAADSCTGSRPYALEVLPAPPAVTDLAAVRVVSGNDGDGTTKILVTFTAPPGTDSVEVYRAPFGHYPEYDDGGGAVPVTPSYPPGAPWLLTGVTAGGQTDEPSARDFHYYIVFTRNAGGGVSPVSNKTSGTCNYALGDVSNGYTPGTGNNEVGAEDVSLLGAHYGIGAVEIASRGVAYLDVGPTTDLLMTSRPFTDKRLDFEDLIVLATNYGEGASLLFEPLAAIVPSPAAGPERLEVLAPSLVEAGETVTAILRVEGAGRMQGFSATLAWDPAVVEPVGWASGGFVEGQRGVVLTSRPGTVDAALLGRRGSGITGAGDVARVSFRALRAGDAAIRLDRVIARDPVNQPLPESAVESATRADAPAHTLLLAPWPNPAQGAATLEFALAESGDVELALYSVDGRRVRTLASGRREAGVHRVRWAADDDGRRAVAPGVYYARLVAGGHRFTRTLVVLR